MNEVSTEFEIHCVKAERVDHTSSVQGWVKGRVSGTVSVSGGSGGGSTSGYTEGSTYTVHEYRVVAGGRTYVFKTKDESFPIAEGDDMVFLLRSGDMTAFSAINNTTGTNFIRPLDSLFDLKKKWSWPWSVGGIFWLFGSFSALLDLEEPNLQLISVYLFWLCVGVLCLVKARSVSSKNADEERTYSSLIASAEKTTLLFKSLMGVTDKESMTRLLANFGGKTHISGYD